MLNRISNPVSFDFPRGELTKRTQKMHKIMYLSKFYPTYPHVGKRRVFDKNFDPRCGDLNSASMIT